MPSKPQIPDCTGISFTPPLQQGRGSLILSIPNYLPSRQGKSLDYAWAGGFDKILQKYGKNKGIRLILRRFFNPSETFFK